MSRNNRFIKIAQQPPAVVSRGEMFNYIAYFPKSSPYEYHQEEDVKVQDGNDSVGRGQASFPTYRSGGFATASVIPAEGTCTKIPLSFSSSSSLEKWNGRMVIGSGRADFNRTNEDDRTIRFELGIKCTGKFIVVVHLHKQHMPRALRVGGNGGETRASSIITSVVTRTIQVVERKSEEEDDTRSKFARYGRLTPPPPMDRVEDRAYETSHLDDGRKPLPTDASFNGRRDIRRCDFLIMARPKDANLTEKEANGSKLRRKGKKKQPNMHVSTSTPHEQQNARHDNSEPGKDSWNNEGDNMGASLLNHGRLITPRPKSILLEEKKTDGDNWSDDDDSDDEGGVKLF